MSSLTDSLALARLLERLTPAMREAAALIERMRADGSAPRRQKADRSPVTDADDAAEAVLTAAIRHLDTEGVIVGEEAASAGRTPGAAARMWLIDPLDGTASFVRGGQDYTVNVGLIEDRRPVLGLVLHPPSGTLWTGAEGLGAWRQVRDGHREAIRTRSCATPVRCLVSHSHLDQPTKAWIESIPGAEAKPSGSSMKFCLLAEGAGDAYPRCGPTSEWDTAAADAVLRAAGGITLAADGLPLAYGKPDHANGPFLALGDRQASRRLPPFPPQTPASSPSGTA